MIGLLVVPETQGLQPPPAPFLLLLLGFIVRGVIPSLRGLGFYRAEDMVAISVRRTMHAKREFLKHAPKLKEATKAPGHSKKPKNVWNDIIDGKVGKIYIPEQEISKIALTRSVKGLKRKRRAARKNKGRSKKHKVDPE